MSKRGERGVGELLAEREALEHELVTSTVEARLAAVNREIAERERLDAERAERERLARVAELVEVRAGDERQVVEALQGFADALAALGRTEARLRGEGAGADALSPNVPSLLRDAVRRGLKWYELWRPGWLGLPERRSQSERERDNARARLRHLEGLRDVGVYGERGAQGAALDRVIKQQRGEVAGLDRRE